MRLWIRSDEQWASKIDASPTLLSCASCTSIAHTDKQARPCLVAAMICHHIKCYIDLFYKKTSIFLLHHHLFCKMFNIYIYIMYEWFQLPLTFKKHALSRFALWRAAWEHGPWCLQLAWAQRIEWTLAHTWPRSETLAVVPPHLQVKEFVVVSWCCCWLRMRINLHCMNRRGHKWISPCTYLLRPSFLSSMNCSSRWPSSFFGGNAHCSLIFVFHLTDCQTTTTTKKGFVNTDFLHVKMNEPGKTKLEGGIPDQSH